MLTIAPATADDLHAVKALMVAYAQSLPFDLSYQGFEKELAALPAPYVPPGGQLLVAKIDGTCVGVGAYRPCRPGTAEIKRMYIQPAAQGKGLGRSILAALIDHARAAGYRWLCLDTHRPSMGPALRLYQSLGFREVEPYGDDLGGEIVCLAMELA